MNVNKENLLTEEVEDYTDVMSEFLNTNISQSITSLTNRKYPLDPDETINDIIIYDEI